MGTKLEPGKFDCVAKAEPDEPMFTLLARDPVGADFVAMWAHLRNADWNDAERVWLDLTKKLRDRHHRTKLAPTVEEAAAEQDKVNEAIQCSSNMRRWIEKNRPGRVL